MQSCSLSDIYVCLQGYVVDYNFINYEELHITEFNLEITPRVILPS